MPNPLFLLSHFALFFMFSWHAPTDYYSNIHASFSTFSFSTISRPIKQIQHLVLHASSILHNFQVNILVKHQLFEQHVSLQWAVHNHQCQEEVLWPVHQLPISGGNVVSRTASKGITLRISAKLCAEVYAPSTQPQHRFSSLLLLHKHIISSVNYVQSQFGHNDSHLLVEII